jgi:MinD-like ATPase involved in chromosome partitioning or flagellar assembly
MVESTDSGKPFVAANPQSQVAEAFRTIASNWGKLLKERTPSRRSFFKKAGSA